MSEFLAKYNEAEYGPFKQWDIKLGINGKYFALDSVGEPLSRGAKEGFTSLSGTLEEIERAIVSKWTLTGSKLIRRVP